MSKLRQVRLAHGMGLNETAREAGINPSCLSRLERGLAQNPRHAEIMARYWRGEITEAEILYPRRGERYPSNGAAGNGASAKTRKGNRAA